MAGVKITTSKFISIEAGRGILHVVLVEPWKDVADQLPVLKEADDPFDIEIITDDGELELNDVRLLNYDIVDEDLIALTLSRVFW